MLPDVGTRRRKAEPVVDQYSAEDLQNAGRLKQIRMVAKLVNQQNKRALPITFGAAAAIIVIFVAGRAADGVRGVPDPRWACCSAC